MYTDVSHKKISFSRVISTAVLAILAVCMASVSSAKDEKTHTFRQSPPVEEGLYLVIDMPGSEISLRLAEVELREHAFTVLSDSEMTAEFMSNWSKERSRQQTVESVHLLSAAATIPESELKIIEEETALDVDEIQRYLPGRMVLITNEGLRIYIDTDCPNAKPLTWERIKEFFRRVWYGLIAGDSLHIRMSAIDAMSLYGAAKTKPAVTIKP